MLPSRLLLCSLLHISPITTSLSPPLCFIYSPLSHPSSTRSSPPVPAAPSLPTISPLYGDPLSSGVPTRPFWRWMWCRGYHSKASAASLPSGGSGNCGDNQGMEERGWGGREMESDCIEHWHTAKGSAEGRCCFVLSAAHAE